jgi:hypothetical protein
MVLGGTAVGAATVAGTARGAGRHAKIAAAITALEEAHLYIRKAGHNFGGHKEDALLHIDKALHHLRLCLKY